jgi:hypothetical protein
MPASPGRDFDDDDDRPRRRRDDDDDRPRRYRDEDDEDDRPRSRRRRDEDDEDDRPRARRHRDEDDEDDRPRRRRRHDDDEDFPRRRLRRRRSNGPGIGKILAIVGGCLAAVGLIAAVILLATGTFSSGRGDISYEKFAAVGPDDTIEGLGKRFGRPDKYDRSEWGRVAPGSQGGRRPPGEGTSSLAAYNHFAREVTAWYGWRKGKEEIYIAEGTDFKGRTGPVIKIYCNPKVVEDAVLRPDAPKTNIPWFEVDQIGGDGRVRFGGG